MAKPKKLDLNARAEAQRHLTAMRNTITAGHLISVALHHRCKVDVRIQGVGTMEFDTHRDLHGAGSKPPKGGR